MKTLLRIIIASLVVLLMGSMPESTAYARHFSHGARVGVGIWLGPGWWPGWGWPYYYPSYNSYYQEPPIVIEQQPEVYVQPTPQAEQPIYWYYCQSPQGYYPYVKRCPNGWLKVVPTPPTTPHSPPE